MKGCIRVEPNINYESEFRNLVKGVADKNSTLLDLGTGEGKAIFDIGLYRICKKCVGIDISEEHIKKCKSKAKKSKNLDFRVMDALGKLDFPSKFFDIVTAMFSPYNPKEVYRVLKNNGIFIMIWPLKGEHKEVTAVFPQISRMWKGGLRFDTLEDRRIKLERAGLDVCGNVVLEYKWFFKNFKRMRDFYSTIFGIDVYEKRKQLLRMLKINKKGEIEIRRRIAITIAKKSS